VGAGVEEANTRGPSLRAQKLTVRGSTEGGGSGRCRASRASLGKVSQDSTPSCSLLERTAGLWSTVAAAGVGIALFSGAASPVRFRSEHIVVRAGGDHIAVEGLYEYHNPAPFPTALRLGVPFPVDSDHPPPTELALDEVDGGGRSLDPLQPAVHGSDISVRFLFGPFETRRLRVRYTQPTAVPRGRYILTTTRAWGEPVEQASFELHLAHGAELVSSNYPLQQLRGLGGWARHGFERARLWPDRDWEFAWANKETS